MSYKNILAPVLLSGGGIAVTLLVVELIVRVFLSSPPPQWSDRPREYFIAEASTTFQDYPHALPKPSDTYRIAVIGDSFTFAPYVQFDDAFPQRMERFLNLNSGIRRVEVINYGVPAYSTNHEVPVVRRAIHEGADFILMQITFNDPEIKPYTPTELHRDHLRFGELKLEGALYEYWRTLAFIRTRLHNTETHNNYVKKFFDLFERPRTWKNFSHSWRTIVETARASSVPLGAVVFPLFGLPMDDRYPFHPLHEKVGRFLGELNVPVHDLYRDFEGIPLERLQVIVGRDFHPNEIGHRIAAESILRWFQKEGLIPPEFIPRVSAPLRIGIRKPGSTQVLPEEQVLRESVDTPDEDLAPPPTASPSGTSPAL